MTRALAMISGGLDSILAAKLIKEQGIEVIGICFKSYFFNEENARRMVGQIDVPLEVVDFSEEHFEMVRNPKHGYGKNINPCIDCHAMMMRYCGELLEKFQADFIITGEVLNQRPMSQNKGALNAVKKESGIGNKILRPLCALNLEPTEMELSGMVDREKLMGISGRSRKIQMELAEKWNIKDYPSPAGGCKLTEPNFSDRMKDLLKYQDKVDEKDLRLLTIGRHFRMSPTCKIISTRVQEETATLKECLNKSDLCMLARDYKGSLIAIKGEPSKEELDFAASVTKRYCKGKNEENVVVRYGHYGSPSESEIIAKDISEEEFQKYLL
ncbi:Thiamine biosynthesis protein (ThiI) [Hathewaya proteolytica DSM 3090]|uniref:Thiamine biosynthesis protein (ThiI) n=1 Tax=Hathewaya proteolytica DSM 3090 TaxID=1121331 RepID=A0A1M6S802_9CLOT|nr:ThiI domain-containing protein [Hathewaya proteolytica]SHK40830.1 Thiamine biosynthesis protein (ThiI) [Hathewaya proteolytica DSM 3090]